MRGFGGPPFHCASEIDRAQPAVRSDRSLPVLVGTSMLVTCAVAQIHGDAVIPTGDRLDGSAHIPNGQNPAASGMRANEVKAPATGARRAVGGGAPPCRTTVDDYACVGGSCAELQAKPNVAV